MKNTLKFKTLKNENLSEKVSNEIVQMILDSTLKTGEKLPSEPVLSSQLGISRGILREALTILSAKGFIKRTPGCGTFIRDLPEYSANGEEAVLKLFKNASYLDILEVRGPLEKLCVELVISRASDQEIENLEKDLQDLRQKGMSEIVNFNFHLRLAELSKNLILINLISSYSGLINEFAHDVYAIDERYKNSLNEHFKILEAIKKRDFKTATTTMEEHLTKAKEMLSRRY
jgi:GntR family transcriptional repressor for pyruvate dehydrogenase complex